MKSLYDIACKKCLKYLEYVGNNIANNGATFQGKSAMGNMGCVQNMTGAVMVAKPPLEAQLDSADEILVFPRNYKIVRKENFTNSIVFCTCIRIFSFVIRRI